MLFWNIQSLFKFHACGHKSVPSIFESGVISNDRRVASPLEQWAQLLIYMFGKMLAHSKCYLLNSRDMQKQAGNFVSVRFLYW